MFFVEHKFKANTICLPFNEIHGTKLRKNGFMDADVTVVGWGYTQVVGNRGNVWNKCTMIRNSVNILVKLIFTIFE